MPPATPATLLDVLARRARDEPRSRAFVFRDEPCTCERLWREALAVSSHLIGHGIGAGDRVLLALDNGPEFFFAFYGIQLSGAAAVPLFPRSGPERLSSLAGLADAAGLVVSDDLDEAAREALKRPGRSVWRFSECRSEARGRSPSLPAQDDLAYLQYTSGSTGDPKGVRISHANLVANIRQMVAGMGLTGGDVFVSWLPVHHDMGLVLMTMTPLYLGAEVYLLPANLRNVRAWLDSIERRRGTFTAAPDFAWRLTLRYLRDPGKHDLASLRVALNAAEPVRASTLRDFGSAFALRDVMVPGYGLAEATVGVSMWPAGNPVAVDERGFVSVGPPFPGVEVRILADGRQATPGETGEIAIRGPSNTAGYWCNEAASAALFRGDGFLGTGDLGYLDAAGNLFVVGREKNIIIQGGRNIAPREVEEIVDTVPGVRASAAVGVDRGGVEGEQLYVFAEVARGRTLPESELRHIHFRAVNAVFGRLGLRPGRVYLTLPGTVPRTANGKIRHARLRELYAGGELRDRELLLFPGY